MKTFGLWVYYTALRLLFIAVPFVIMLYVLPAGLWFWAINAIVSVVIGFCLSYLLLRTTQQRLAASLQRRRSDKKALKSDVEVEDAVTADEAADYTPSVGSVLDENEERQR